MGPEMGTGDQLRRLLWAIGQKNSDRRKKGESGSDDGSELIGRAWPTNATRDAVAGLGNPRENAAAHIFRSIEPGKLEGPDSGATSKTRGIRRNRDGDGVERRAHALIRRP